MCNIHWPFNMVIYGRWNNSSDKKMFTGLERRTSYWHYYTPQSSNNKVPFSKLILVIFFQRPSFFYALCLTPVSHRRHGCVTTAGWLARWLAGWLTLLNAACRWRESLPQSLCTAHLVVNITAAILNVSISCLRAAREFSRRTYSCDGVILIHVRRVAFTTEIPTAWK